VAWQLVQAAMVVVMVVMVAMVAMVVVLMVEGCCSPSTVESIERSKCKCRTLSASHQ